MPQLLQALASTGDADAAFVSFDRFMARLPAGVQLFSMLRANPHLLHLLATILGTAPRLAEQLSRRPKVFDAVLDPGFFDHLPDRDEIARTFDDALASENRYEARDRINPRKTVPTIVVGGSVVRGFSPGSIERRLRREAEKRLAQ